MQESLPDSELAALARRAGFDPLSQAELAVLRAAPTGNHAVCGSSDDPKNPSNDPTQSDEWDSQRELRAGLLEWLATTPDAAKAVHRTGLFIRGGKITGDLNLANLAVPFPLTLNQCRLTNRTWLIGSQIRSLHLEGSWLHSLCGDEVVIAGSVWVTGGFSAAHGVRLIGADIGGDLICRDGLFNGPRREDDPRSGYPLNAERISVGRTLFLDGGFMAHGEVRLLGARIGSDLICKGGRFRNAWQQNSPDSGNALSADGASVAGSVFLGENFIAEGEVRLLGAQIGRQLDCAGGTFKNAIPDGKALLAERATINGSVFLSQSFSAEGEIRLLGAHIGGDLDCSGGRFAGLAQTGNAMRAERASIGGSVLLKSGFSASGEVRLVGVQVAGDLECSDGSFENAPRQDVKESGVALRADRTSVKGSMSFDGKFCARGGVRIEGSQVGGNLVCRGGKFVNPPQTGSILGGEALNADGVQVVGDVHLDDGFLAEGEVRFLGARINGNIECCGGTFSNPAQGKVHNSGVALAADDARVAGSVFLSEEFSSTGQVRFLGTEIGGNLSCGGGKFMNPAQEELAGSGTALSASGATIKGDVSLSDGFSAEGEVRLVGAQIGGDLDCDAGKLTNPTGKALAADRMKVNGSVFLRQGFTADGAVWLIGAQIGGDLSCGGGAFTLLKAQTTTIRGNLFFQEVQHADRATVDLTNSTVGALVDDETSWPRPGSLYLDGFTYSRIPPKSADPRRRLQWLKRQGPFSAHPYRQLATVLREGGDQHGARIVLSERERNRRNEKAARTPVWGRLNRLWSWVLRVSIGYGYNPGRAGWLLWCFALVGMFLFSFGYKRCGMAPTDKEAYTYFQSHGCEPPPYYPRFNAFFYSLQNSVPVLPLGQVSAWQPDPALRGSRRLPYWLTASSILRNFGRLQTLAGWVLVTFFLAGVTDVVRKE